MACAATGLAQAVSYPKEVTKALSLAGENRSELEKVLDHYGKSATDSLRFKAACFLIANMSCHTSRMFYWADSTGTRVPFDEFSYPDFNSAVASFNQMSIKQKLKPEVYNRDDLQSMTADYLIKNIDDAFVLKEKAWAKGLTFDQFCEYLLPYRFMDEPYSEWRISFYNEYLPITKPLFDKKIRQACITLSNNLKNSFYNTYISNPLKIEPAFLSPKQMIFRNQGACEDMANWGGYILRSMGIGAAIDYTPAWATSTGSHYWNVAFSERGEGIPFFMTDNDPNTFMMNREPSKVFRITYSIQKNTLAQQVPLKEIPEGNLRLSNYFDVTKDYWKVGNITIKQLNKNKKATIVYASVFNGMSWRPIWWGTIKKKTVELTDMSCGVVYLPQYYENEKLIPASFPHLLRPDRTVQVLEPDTMNTRSITVETDNEYIIIRKGSNYHLFYWYGKWINVQSIKAENASSMTFDKAPRNALFVLVPEYSAGKERPFTVDDSGTIERW